MFVIENDNFNYCDNNQIIEIVDISVNFKDIKRVATFWQAYKICNFFIVHYKKLKEIEHDFKVF